jgi:hypothetical protein
MSDLFRSETFSCKQLNANQINVAKSEKMKTGSNLEQSSKKGYDSKSVALPIK